MVAGDQFVRVAAAPAGLPVTHGPGYDGQFFYRRSLRPWTQQRTESGITLDEPAYRQQRIVYPLVSFVVARCWAATSRRRRRWGGWGRRWRVGAAGTPCGGLALAAYPGFVLVIARDLADLVAAALLAGIL